MRRWAGALVIAGMVGLAVAVPHAQGGRGGRGQAPPIPKAAAPFDLTGYWTAVVTRDWRFRMVVPPKGDYAGVPLNAAARKVADAWDPARDEAAGEQCRSYGAANIMRVPGRLHITWQDDRTLKIETDAGMQTRVFSFATAPIPTPIATPIPTPAAGGTWQGTSTAQWEVLPGLRGQAPLTGSLKVVTTNLKPGYLRTNGVPYSAKTTLTEYFDRITQPNGDAHLIITTTIDDPEYLTQPYLYSTHFKRQADATGWAPRPCSAR
jgi:hypothetical protein